MIKEVINYINAKIVTLNLFNEVLCLCEKITQGDNKFPAQEIGSQFKSIDLDKKDGVSYWRKNGDVNIDPIESQTSCATDYQFNVPLKFVGFVRRDKANVAEDILIGNIIKEITTNNAALKASLQAKKVSILCKSYKTNRDELASEEYDGFIFKPKFEFLYFSIEVELVVLTNNNCIPTIC